MPDHDRLFRSAAIEILLENELLGRLRTRVRPIVLEQLCWLSPRARNDSIKASSKSISRDQPAAEYVAVMVTFICGDARIRSNIIIKGRRDHNLEILWLGSFDGCYQDAYRSDRIRLMLMPGEYLNSWPQGACCSHALQMPRMAADPLKDE